MTGARQPVRKRKSGSGGGGSGGGGGGGKVKPHDDDWHNLTKQIQRDAGFSVYGPINEQDYKKKQKIKKLEERRI